MLDCFGCASVWVGVGVALLDRVSRDRQDHPCADVAEVALTGLALSGAAFVLQKVLNRDEPPTWLPEPEVDSPLVTVEPM